VSHVRQHVDEGAHASVRKVTRLLIRDYGMCIGGENLRRLLGFKSARAFGHAVRRGHLSLNFFKFPGRRGRYVLATDVAEWISKLAQPASAQTGKEAQKSGDEPKKEGLDM